MDDLYYLISSSDSELRIIRIIIAIIAFAAGIVLTCTIFHKKNEGKFKGFMGWLHKFMNFKEKIFSYVLIALKWIWKSLYLIGAISITLSAIILPISSLIILNGYYTFTKFIIDFFVTLIVGNLVWRLVCELVPAIILFIPRIIRKLFRWFISVPHRPRPFVVQKGDEVTATPEDIVSWNYFKEKKPAAEPEKTE